SFVVLTLSGAVMAASPWPAAIVFAAAAGLFNAWAWLGITRALALRPSRRFVPIAPVGIAAVIAILLLGVLISVNLETAKHKIERPPSAGRPGAPVSGQPLMVITGYDSHWHGGDELEFGPGFVQRRFSYAGMDGRGQPLIFHGPQTDQPLANLV